MNQYQAEHEPVLTETTLGRRAFRRAWLWGHRASRRASRGASGDMRILRMLPRSSPLHRLWAGTKILAILAFGVVMSFKPTWAAEAVLAGALGLGLAVARVPLGALPRVLRWVWLGVLVSALVALAAGGRPYVHLGGASVGIGSLATWARFVALTLLLLLASALVAWTTALADLAPALARLLRPLALVKVPVDEIVAASALGVRCLPLLVEELTTLNAARRVRRTGPPANADEWVNGGVDLLVSAMVAATRRGAELGQAIEARGGPATAVGRAGRPCRVDVVAMVVVAATVAAIAVL